MHRTRSVIAAVAAFTLLVGPAFASAADVVSCSYTDPAGLFVEITGVLSGR